MGYTWSVIVGPDMVVKYSSAGSVSEYIIQNLLDEYIISGDINEDDYINIQDVILAINLVLDAEYNTLSDLNYDAMVDILDIILLVNIILE